jgi:uncharacterized DUF497 family protein
VKPIRLTQHAETVMRERDLRLEWIEAAATSPDWREPDPQDPSVERRFRVVPEREGRILRVACVETAEEIRIVSAFLDRRARPK